MDEPEDDEWWDYDSGPFCWHWSDPADCDEKCARAGCGHGCGQHAADDGEAGCFECDCPAWFEEEAATPV